MLTYNSEMTDKKQSNDSSNSTETWFKRLGVGAFLFFLIKGLIWIAIFMGLGKYFVG